MEKIEIGEGCFGPHVLIDGESLFVDEFCNAEDELKRNELKKELINKLLSQVDSLDMMDLRTIAEIVVSRGKYEYLEEDSYRHTCDQCGNYNYNDSYLKIEEK